MKAVASLLLLSNSMTSLPPEAKKAKTTPDDKELRYLEFYAGVGGWRMALEEALHCDHVDKSIMIPSSTRCVGALEHSDLCLDVYHHNFQSLSKEKKPKACRIEQIKVDQLVSEWRADAWFMSPPCQPHTRQHDNQSADLNDPRSSSFLHLCKLLEDELPDDALPTMICLENVIGFADSNSCSVWRRALSKREYAVAHFHWNPTQVNLPNDRPRYFCLAVRQSEMSRHPLPAGLEGILFMEKVVDDDPQQEEPILIQTSLGALGVVTESEVMESSLPRIKQFLDPDTAAKNHVVVPDKILERNASWCFDIVTEDSQRSACFTSGYGKFVKGTGSVLYTGVPLAKEDRVNGEKSNHLFDLQRPEDREFDADWAKSLASGSLRYFSGREIARLMGFASSFSFPDSCSAKQQWKLVGNSLNVRLAAKVVALGLCLSGKLALVDETIEPSSGR